MKARFFQNRDGQTPLEEEMRHELRYKHVQDMTELYELELENMAEADIWCDSTYLPHLDYPTWLELHKKMLGNVWKFAGIIRTKELANPDFYMPYNVRSSMLQLEKDLKYWLANKTYPPQEMMAIFHEKLLTIHPFKDGNGRWARMLTEFICKKENFQLPNWGRNIEHDELRRKTYIEAVKVARYDFNYLPLIQIMWYSITQDD